MVHALWIAWSDVALILGLKVVWRLVRARQAGQLARGKVVEIRRKRLCDEHDCRFEYQLIYLTVLPNGQSVRFAGAWSQTRPTSDATVQPIVTHSGDDADEWSTRSLLFACASALVDLAGMVSALALA